MGVLSGNKLTIFHSYKLFLCKDHIQAVLQRFHYREELMRWSSEAGQKKDTFFFCPASLDHLR